MLLKRNMYESWYNDFFDFLYSWTARLFSLETKKTNICLGFLPRWILCFRRVTSTINSSFESRTIEFNTSIRFTVLRSRYWEKLQTTCEFLLISKRAFENCVWIILMLVFETRFGTVWSSTLAAEGTYSLWVKGHKNFGRKWGNF